MTWNYRIKQEPAGGFSLVEVHYDDDGKLAGYTGPIEFVAYKEEGPKGIIKSLKRALRDAAEYPVFTVKDVGKPGPPRRTKAPIPRKKVKKK